ncbi:PDR/VanB family oxidoreductase [Spongiactinospora sp. TRM90649]|uniref:PDR/VanB family oxidoreductase n=1 Tax=Spongiactinospora sp. TRM90649 TaxID=3031114 RepID=UPI0023F9AFBC|nr:PDR/VanB family oxidoreductase [Spongiactinospora sp. TRM90649]MDF5758083.1 PDR/VanB family oxidoreductase [Spongiactinospora sp. TRM90649]
MMVNEGGRRLTIEAIEREARNIVALRLVDPAGGELPPWEPGAHIDVQLITRHLRQYSLCGDPGDTRRYRVAVLKERLSRGASEYVHSYLREGKQVRVWEPRNHFRLEAAERYVFVAGGIGITPILPMVKQAQRTGVPWRLIYTVRTPEDAAFRDELARLGGGVRLHASDERGLLDLRAALGAPREGTGVYCCGPSGLITALEQAMAGWPAASLHTERFAPVARSVRPDEPFTALCARSGIRVEVPAGTSLLDALRRNRVPAPGSCLRGVCGACSVGVLDGVPEHRDSLLPEGTTDRMHSCVSRAWTPEITLDL